jgi:hypothetical protein
VKKRNKLNFISIHYPLVTYLDPVDSSVSIPSIADSTMSTAAGLEKGSSYSATTYQALSYYESPSHLPTYLRQNSNDTEEIPNKY